MTGASEVTPVAPTPTDALLARLARPYDPVRAVTALVGLRERAARQMVGAILATSDEAERLLAAMPHVVRCLSIATSDRPTRCYGELRGPVLWSETMSSRAASAGDPGLYVCATTTKAYDTGENRALVAALSAIRRAGRDAEGHGAPPDDPAHRARVNGVRAARFLEHQTLVSVPVTRITPRALRRTRAGSRRSTYRPAVAMLGRLGEPLTGAHLVPVADEATLTDHALLEGVLRAVEAQTGRLPPLRTAHGDLVSGPVRYRHPSHEDAPWGVLVHGHPVGDVAEVADALRRA